MTPDLFRNNPKSMVEHPTKKCSIIMSNIFFLVEILVRWEKKDRIFGRINRYLYIAVDLYEFLTLRHNMSTTKKLRETYNETQHKIVLYLNSGITKGKHYFKSKYIAKDLGLSPKEVGTNMAILADICKELDIIRWSYSNSTTWMVTPRGAI
jgi:hypothetical protein